MSPINSRSSMVNTMHRLKILQIGYLDPFNNFGGVEKYILDLTSTLSENFGCEVDILCSGNKSTIKKTPFGKLIIISVPNFNVPLYRNLRQIIYSFRAMRYIEKIKQDYDSIHYHGDNGFISSKVGNAVLTLHGLSGPFISKVLDPKQILGLFSFFIELFNVKRAVSVFSISEPVTKFIRELTSITPLDIPQAIKPNLYKDAKTSNKLDLRIELGIDPRAFVGIIIGREPRRKGLDIAVEAFKIINDKRYKLLVIGFPGYQVNSDYVKYLGDVEEEYKVKCIKASDFLIMPSKKEGFPIV